MTRSRHPVPTRASSRYLPVLRLIIVLMTVLRNSHAGNCTCTPCILHDAAPHPSGTDCRRPAKAGKKPESVPSKKKRRTQYLANKQPPPFLTSTLSIDRRRVDADSAASRPIPPETPRRDRTDPGRSRHAKMGSPGAEQGPFLSLSPSPGQKTAVFCSGDRGLLTLRPWSLDPETVVS